MVVSSSINDGDILSPGTIDRGRDLQRADQSGDGVHLRLLASGHRPGMIYTPASITFDGTDTVSRSSTTASRPTLTRSRSMPVRRLPELRGRPAARPGYTVNFTVPWGTNPFPVPLKPIAPLGGLAYQGSVDNVITGSGETDTYTLAGAGQPDPRPDRHAVSPGLQPVVTLYDPNGTLIATATASGPGQVGLHLAGGQSHHRHLHVHGHRRWRERSASTRSRPCSTPAGPVEPGRSSQQHHRHRPAARSLRDPDRLWGGPRGSARQPARQQLGRAQQLRLRGSRRPVQLHRHHGNRHTGAAEHR